MKLTREFVEERFGDLSKLDKELTRFSKAAKDLSSRHPRLVNKYPKRWVAVHGGKVRAHAASFNALQKQIDKKGLPRNRIIVRYIDRHRRAMILPIRR